MRWRLQHKHTINLRERERWRKRFSCLQDEAKPSGKSIRSKIQSRFWPFNITKAQFLYPHFAGLFSHKCAGCWSVWIQFAEWHKTTRKLTSYRVRSVLKIQFISQSTINTGGFNIRSPKKFALLPRLHQVFHKRTIKCQQNVKKKIKKITDTNREKADILNKTIRQHWV